MIRISNLSIEKGQKQIFKNLNLDLVSGKSYALVGSSGSGKSTLLNSIAGFEKLSEGAIYINENKESFRTDFYRFKLGYLFQNYGLVETLSVQENIEMGLAFKKVSKAKKQALIDDYMEKFGLSFSKKRKIATLSGGEQQRVSLIRLLLKDPSIILADEPTGALDKKNGEVIINALFNLVDENKLLVIATHDMDIAERCDAIINVEHLRRNEN